MNHELLVALMGKGYDRAMWGGVYCGDKEKAGVDKGSRFTCFKKGVGVGIQIAEKKAETKDLATMTLRELGQEASRRKVPGYSRMKKEQLIEALREVRGGMEPSTPSPTRPAGPPPPPQRQRRREAPASAAMAPLTFTPQPTPPPTPPGMAAVLFPPSPPSPPTPTPPRMANRARSRLGNFQPMAMELPTAPGIIETPTGSPMPMPYSPIPGSVSSSVRTPPATLAYGQYAPNYTSPASSRPTTPYTRTSSSSTPRNVSDSPFDYMMDLDMSGGAKHCMSKKAYLAEHKRLISMLTNVSKSTGKEAAEQIAEVKGKGPGTASRLERMMHSKDLTKKNLMAAEHSLKGWQYLQHAPQSSQEVRQMAPTEIAGWKKAARKQKKEADLIDLDMGNELYGLEGPKLKKGGAESGSRLSPHLIEQLNQQYRDLIMRMMEANGTSHFEQFRNDLRRFEHAAMDQGWSPNMIGFRPMNAFNPGNLTVGIPPAPSPTPEGSRPSSVRSGFSAVGGKKCVQNIDGGCGLCGGTVGSAKPTKRLINFNKIHWGALTKTFESYKKKHDVADIKEFAHRVVANPSEFNKATVKRARFYVNVLKN